MADRVFYTVVITSVLIAIVILFFIVSIIRYNQRYIQLQKERIQAQIMILEQERKRIAHDLHDSLGPLLSTVKLYVNNTEPHTDADRQSVDKASAYIDEAINNLREISYNLLPPSLDRNNLIVVVKEYLSRISSHHILKIHFETSPDLIIPKKIEIHLFRVIQEIVHNTIKHSKAAHLTLSISKQSNYLFLISKDNGIGFDLYQVRHQSEGLGLKSIENRCEMIDAALRIVTSKNKGCKMVIKVFNP